jgi:hypothetical protein
MLNCSGTGTKLKLRRLLSAGFNLSRNDRKIVLFGRLLTTLNRIQDADRLILHADVEIDGVTVKKPAQKRDQQVLFFEWAKLWRTAQRLHNLRYPDRGQIDDDRMLGQLPQLLHKRFLLFRAGRLFDLILQVVQDIADRQIYGNVAMEIPSGNATMNRSDVLSNVRTGLVVPQFDLAKYTY